jgi:hypothetical protein
MQTYLDKVRNASFPKLVEEAFTLFHALFRDKLLQVSNRSALRGSLHSSCT